MMSRNYGLVIASLLAIAAGCTQGTTTGTMSPELLASYQSSLALATEPDQAFSVLEVRELLGGGESVAHDEDGEDHPAHDGHGHDADAANHAEHDADAHTEHAADHPGHDEGDAHAEHEDADGHEHGEEGHEHAGNEHDGHDDAAHEHGEHDGHDHDHGHNHASDRHAVVIVGKIGGAAGAEQTLSDFPWEKGRATFIISDPSFEPTHDDSHEHDHGHDHGQDGHECHFCQATAIDAQAWVRFLGEDDQPLAVDTRELFAVKEGDIVVIKGHAKLSAGLLVVDAEGMHVRR